MLKILGIHRPVRVAGITYDTPMILVPGLTAVTYTSGYSLGTQFDIPLPAGCRSGMLQKVYLMDRAKQSLQVDLEIFRGPFTSGVNNSAFAISDQDHLKKIGTVQITADLFSSYNTEAGATKAVQGFTFSLEEGEFLRCQAVARGAAAVAAAGDYGVVFGFLLDPSIP